MRFKTDKELTSFLSSTNNLTVYYISNDMNAFKIEYKFTQKDQGLFQIDIKTSLNGIYLIVGDKKGSIIIEKGDVEYYGFLIKKTELLPEQIEVILKNNNFTENAVAYLLIDNVYYIKPPYSIVWFVYIEEQIVGKIKPTSQNQNTMLYVSSLNNSRPSVSQIKSRANFNTIKTSLNLNSINSKITNNIFSTKIGD